MENEVKNIEKFYMPFVLCTHTLGNKYGNYVAPVYLTLKELRRWYPEPQKYVIMNMEK